MLEIRNASFWYAVEHPPIVYDCNVSVGECEFVAVIGESGSGKSTLLRLACGLLQQSLRQRGESAGALLGTAEYFGDQIDRPHHSFGYVPQNFAAALVPSLNVIDNILLPARHGGIDVEEAARAQKLMELSGIAALADEFVYRISGGQKQRVAICRALINQPRVVFMDEPFANLDPSLRPEIGDLLKRLRTESSLAILFVTHDVSGAVRLADRIVGVRRLYGRPEYTRWNPPFNVSELERWMAY